MATSNYNDLGVVYNHPSIISNISNKDTIFQSSLGRRPFFYVITADKGEDNVTKLISDDKEFIFNYGEPNLKKHGQAAFNILNILQSKESVYVLRVLPENAGYSHAFLNIQTKIEGVKRVKNINGEPVEISNVVVKPTVTYSKANNVSKELLNYELRNNKNQNTIDGYKNNLLFYVIPKGRGEYYDKFGFRIYLNPSYDESYDFRVYNFEVVEFDEYDNARVIEGPFYVSLDPDALSASNESMFITDVINRYSQYVTCEFNEEAYDRIAAVINPEVSPAHLDLLTGQTRVFNNMRENFFCKETQQYEDVHILIHKYDDNGNVIMSNGRPVTTFVESTDKVEQSIISIDNSVRDRQYKRNQQSLSNMKQGITDLYNNLYEASITKIGKLEGDSFAEDSKVIKTKAELTKIWEEFEALYNKYKGEPTEINFIDTFSKSTTLENKLEELKGYFRFLIDYARLIKDDSRILVLLNAMSELQSKSDTKEVVSIKFLNYKNKLTEALTSLVKLKSLQSVSEETEAIKLILIDVKKIMDFISVNLKEENEEFTTIKNLYNGCVHKVSVLEDEFFEESQKDETLISLYKDLDTIITTSLKLCNALLLEGEKDFGEKVVETSVYEIQKSLEPVIKSALETYNDAVGNTVSKENMIESAKQVAGIQQEITVSSKSLMYTTQLQNFNSPISFNFGSDGDLAEKDVRKRNKTISSLLIKGYKGLIDANITNKKKIPARFVLDANYPIEVKNAIYTFITEIRDDIFFYADLGFTASPEEALNVRNKSFNISSNKAAIYAQDAVIYDEFNGKDIKVTASYFLANKVPKCAREYGLHYPIAGNRRGTIDGFKNLSWIPNEVYKELLYNRKINYIESDERRTKFGSQLTSEAKNTPLSNINNVITVIDIKNDVEVMAEDYQFEFNNQETINVFQNELNDYLSKYISSKAVETIKAVVYASDYDKKQKILRVQITLKFHDIIERIIISLDVVK